ncbi:MAG: fibronectin type III domain-containing protein [Candidatus Moranbacteria bacterium]|nr:fibronectin type III domain-containing protein [Candidatus Moranbacteria bacterium]
MKKIIKIILLAVLVISIGYFSMMILSFRSTKTGTKETAATISNEKTAGKVLGEEENDFATQAFVSQNFHSPQITFGGDAITVPSGEQSVAPEILNMQSELLMTKTDQQVKFLLSWKTNKPCVSSIAYAKEGQAEEKTVSEDGYGFLHSVEIAPLNFSTSYSYAVTARDKWGNEIKSDKLAFYTGAPNVSILDLLGGAFKDMFGWAGKK